MNKITDFFKNINLSKFLLIIFVALVLFFAFYKLQNKWIEYKVSGYNQEIIKINKDIINRDLKIKELSELNNELKLKFEQSNGQLIELESQKQAVKNKLNIVLKDKTRIENGLDEKFKNISNTGVSDIAKYRDMCKSAEEAAARTGKEEIKCTASQIAKFSGSNTNITK